MTTHSIQQKSWLQSHWKWFVPAIVIILFLIMFFSSGMTKVASDLTKAYSDSELYENALEKVNANQTMISVLGEIQSIDQLAILEGQVNYSEDYTFVKSSIRISGLKGSARLDLIANKVDNDWIYKTINVRIKKPKDQQQTIAIVSND